ncbi:hypothetical protein [Neorhizobium galegae]|uniref:hypothetical protein n=1 Tax=Neorhizobium galegae TaxID=399 RepID=UPI002105DD4D|nr:hypothetical protein [Neorhizobium galegae]MCQ1834776.1 hypothetical protein [Neorhizobium galegae]UIY29741.1 hypothetical protein LZK73_02310 [Neorhizobium galegae]
MTEIAAHPSVAAVSSIAAIRVKTAAALSRSKDGAIEQRERDKAEEHDTRKRLGTEFHEMPSQLLKGNRK